MCWQERLRHRNAWRQPPRREAHASRCKNIRQHASPRVSAQVAGRTNEHVHSAGTASSGINGGGIDGVLALDVEYAHLQTVPVPPERRGRITIVPVEVCLAAPGGEVVLHEFCQPGARVYWARPSR